MYGGTSRCLCGGGAHLQKAGRCCRAGSTPLPQPAPPSRATRVPPRLLPGKQRPAEDGAGGEGVSPPRRAEGARVFPSLSGAAAFPRPLAACLGARTPGGAAGGGGGGGRWRWGLAGRRRRQRFCKRACRQPAPARTAAEQGGGWGCATTALPGAGPSSSSPSLPLSLPLSPSPPAPALRPRARPGMDAGAPPCRCRRRR